MKLSNSAAIPIPPLRALFYLFISSTGSRQLTMAPQGEYQELPLVEDEIIFTTANALLQPAAPMTEISTSEMDLEALSIEDKDFVRNDQNGDIPSGSEFGAVTKKKRVDKRGLKAEKRRFFLDITLIIFGAALLAGAAIPLSLNRKKTPVPSKEVTLTDSAHNIFVQTEFIPVEPVPSKKDQNGFANTVSPVPGKKAADFFGSNP